MKEKKLFETVNKLLYKCRGRNFFSLFSAIPAFFQSSKNLHPVSAH